MNQNKIVVIGCGKVGMTYIYALVNQMNNVDEIIMIDIDKEKLEGERLDLCHTLQFTPNNITVKVGDYSDCNDAKIIVITAGIPQSENDRLKDLEANNVFYQDILAKINETGFNGILLIASNPLDVMTYLAYRYSNLPANQVIGTGTSLDSARLSYYMAESLGVSPKSIHAYVLGEHGASQFVAWSKANIAQQDINRFVSEEQKQALEEKTRNAAYEIIKRKGATYYGISMALQRITNAILKDEEIILPVSNYDKENDVYISTPCILGKNGVKERIYMDLTKEEEAKLTHSINVIKEAIQSVYKEK